MSFGLFFGANFRFRTLHPSINLLTHLPYRNQFRVQWKKTIYYEIFESKPGVQLMFVWTHQSKKMIKTMKNETSTHKGSAPKRSAPNP